jgi:predicted dehydrogenase
MKPVSAGIIGTGDIVISSHLPVLLAMRSVRVAWILDVDTSRCATVGKAYRVPAIKMPEPLANLPEADVVLIATLMVFDGRITTSCGKGRLPSM